MILAFFSYLYFYYYCNFYYYLQAFEEIFGENLRKRQNFNFFYENINENIEKSPIIWYNELTHVGFSISLRCLVLFEAPLWMKNGQEFPC